jgi:predicted ATP-binding protein involved in virulence
VLPTESGRHIQKDDIFQKRYEYGGVLDHQPQLPVCVAAKGEFQGETVEWECCLNKPGGRTTQSPPWRLIGKELPQRVQQGEAIWLPLIAYYGTQRIWLQKKATEAKRGVGSRYDGYVDALEPASNQTQLAEWMYQQTLIELQQGSGSHQLAAVSNAVCRCVGASRFLFNVKSQSLELHVGQEVLPFAMLSDGYRNMVAMVADIAWRASVLNPQSYERAPEATKGVVLIDEVDLHLHPSWQRRVLTDLKEAFPLLQFVVTTHSPQVLAGATQDEVRVLHLEGGPTSPFVQGRDSNSLLEDVFEVSERPLEMKEQLETLSELIDRDDLEAARNRLAELEKLLGPEDPAIVRAQTELLLSGGDDASLQ